MIPDRASPRLAPKIYVIYTFYAQADVYDPNGGPNGLVPESNETNKIGGPSTITAGAQ